MNYKGYTAIVEYSDEDNIFFGKIGLIDDLITFEADSVKDLEQEFHKSVEDYLKICKEVGKNPEKTFKGTFNIRISPGLHKKLSLEALKKSKSLNKIVEQKLEESF